VRFSKGRKRIKYGTRMMRMNIKMTKNKIKKCLIKEFDKTELVDGIERMENEGYEVFSVLEEGRYCEDKKHKEDWINYMVIFKK